MGARVAKINKITLVPYLLILHLLLISKDFVWLEVYKFECVPEQIWLDKLVGTAVHGHGGARVDLEEPGLLLVVDHDVEAHDLEAVLLVRTHLTQVYAC